VQALSTAYNSTALKHDGRIAVNFDCSDQSADEPVWIISLGRHLISSIPFGDCLADGLPGHCQDGRLAKRLPCLWAGCGRAQSRRTRKTTRDRLRIFRLGQRSSGLAAFASLLVTGVPDILLDGADLRCAEHQAEICVLSAPARDRSRRVIYGLGNIHSDGVSWECSSVDCVDRRSFSRDSDSGSNSAALFRTAIQDSVSRRRFPRA
jgi:hypothetical protein